MYVRNGEPFDINSMQVVDDMQYPVGWFYVAANRAALGIVEDSIPPQPLTTEQIAALKAAKNEQINLWRAAANQSTFPHAGKVIACDQLSRSDIDGVANSIGLSGGFPSGFPMAWKAVDNSFIMLPDVDAFKAMYAAMAAQGTANFAHAQMLKEKLVAASTLEEIEAITW